MPKATKRKTAITQLNVAGPSSSSKPQSSRTVIRRFHTLLKQQAQLKAEPQTAHVLERLVEIMREIEELGGLAAYQQMSSIGQGEDRGGGSQKVFINWLKELISADVKGKGKQRLLEVGALRPDNYTSCQSWLDVTPIDLRSRHPDIKEQDFLLLDPEEHREKWDAISLSLVVNFVPDAKDRGAFLHSLYTARLQSLFFSGRMLTLARTILRHEGVLFLALPLPCVMNSRYTTPEHLTSLMEAIGFEKIRERWKQGGKMAYWLFRKAESAPTDEWKFSKKTVLRTGNRNNFVVLL
ncbi:nucleolus protein [Peniophora sp. CONT]|nr:nucleolus protein [Peniophora sp. CONT]